MTRRRLNAREWLMVAVALVLWLVILPMQASATEPAPRVLPAVGDATTYTEQAGTRWCARVRSIVTGAGSVPWAWVTVDADPRRVFAVPLARLRVGCEEGAL